MLIIWNAHVRNTALNISSHYCSKIYQLSTVHIGDSITAAGGGRWSSYISGVPLNAYNLATDGYRVDQIGSLASKAIAYKPEFICVMAGTNDILAARYDEAYSLSRYNEMLNEIRSADIDCIVTLVPYNGSPKKQKEVTSFNQALRKIAATHTCQIVDLNPAIAPEGLLLNIYSDDGLHLNEAGLKVWAKELEAVISEHRNGRHAPAP